MKTMLCALALVLSGCSFLKKGADEPIQYRNSPAGYRFVLHTDNGGAALGVFDDARLGLWLDARIAEWVAQRAAAYGGEAKLRTFANKHSFYLVDHFEVSRGSERPVAGQYDDKRLMVTACIYGYVKVKVKPEGFRFARPVGDGTPDWFHERLLPGREIPVIGHELDHGLGKGHEKK